MAAYPSNKALINAMKHANMKDGEVVIKLNGELITARLKAITMNMEEACYTSINLEAIVTE